MTEVESTVIFYESPDIENPRDIVYLHGRGSSEREAGWALPLFGKASVRSYRAPLAEGAGFAWFKNSGVGTAIAVSIEREGARVLGWIAQDSRRRKPWLCGFSNGGAMAAHLALRAPGTFAGLIVIAGCFPVDDDALPIAGLAGLPVLLCRGTHDDVIPRAKFEQAERYLTGRSGAQATILSYDGGHELPLMIKRQVQAWLGKADRAAT